MKKFILLALVASLGAAHSEQGCAVIRQWLFGHRLLPIMFESTVGTSDDDSDGAVEGPH